MTADIISMTGNRINNQDSLLACGQIYTGEEFLIRSVIPDENRPMLFAVADGMGGEQYGEVASETVLQILDDAFTHALETSDDMEMYVQEIIDALQYAQTEVEELLSKKNASGGTTVSILLMYRGKFIALNIGDSPIFLIRKGKINLLSKEHTLARRKMDEGVPARKISESDHHCLVQCIGMGGYNEINICEGEYFPGDTIAVMSDGMVLHGNKKAKGFVCGTNTWKYMEQFKKAEDNVSAVVIRV